jgi:hypothetical protein
LLRITDAAGFGLASAATALPRTDEDVIATRRRRAALGEPESVTFPATAAYQYRHLERATAGLRAEPRRQLLAADVM